MKISQQFIRPFPEPKDVFATDIEQHSKHFLPICSLNLQIFNNNAEEFWIHFVQPTAICEGRVGEYTTQYHNKYNFADSMCFDVDKNGKYTFSADWRFFEIEHNQFPNLEEKAQEFAQVSKRPLREAIELYQELFEDIKDAYQINPLVYQITKAYYQQYQVLPNHIYDLKNENIEDLKDIRKYVVWLKEKNDTDQYPIENADEIINGLHSDFDEEMKAWANEEGFDSIDELLEKTDQLGNLHHIPRNSKNKVFKYIGYLAGYNFQAYGCDELNLFYDEADNKAIIRLVYS